MRRPATRADIENLLANFLYAGSTPKPDITHSCGAGRLRLTYDVNRTVYECSGCGNVWTRKTMDGLSASQLAERFSVEVPEAKFSERLVWVTVGAKTYTKLVLGSDAGPNEPFDYWGNE